METVEQNLKINQMDFKKVLTQLETALNELHNSNDVSDAAYSTLKFAVWQVKNCYKTDVRDLLPSDSDLLNEIKRRLKVKRLDTEDEIRRAVWYTNGFEEAVKWLRGNNGWV